jgi:hypothetical protein
MHFFTRRTKDTIIINYAIIKIRVVYIDRQKKFEKNSAHGDNIYVNREFYLVLLLS